MSALPRPDLPPGPHRDLADALHDLHHRAGWPSLRRLAADTGVSHTTVSKVLSSSALPAWGTLELLVEAMHGEPTRFHELWLAASTPTDSTPVQASRIAGRRTELAAVRRHLEAGSGLLLVTGEAGIGKTTLVTAASRSADIFVATGHCLPLSTEAPLLAITDAIRSIHDHDPHWLEEALAQCPAYVAASLSRLLPELDAGTFMADDEWSRQRLFAAIGRTLASLVALRPLAVRIEDLHWADSTTQDLLEHLVVRGSPVPLVGTWRVDAIDADAARQGWWNRLRRLPDVQVLELSPLSRDETAEQLTLLTGAAPSSDHLAAVHARAAGHPLFTEQLAAHTEGDPTLPSLLADLLDQRLAGLSDPAWIAVRALGIADRGVPEGLLQTATGLSARELADALHELSGRLMLSTSDQVELRHPLLAEAVRRRLTAGETALEHRRIAVALAETIGVNPAEVAAHWRVAGDRDEERTWRVRAALDARARFAWHLEAEHWQRSVDLWPAGGTGTEPTLAEAQVGLIEALNRASETALAGDAARRVLAIIDAPANSGVTALERADLLPAAGHIVGLDFSPDEGLALVQQAKAIYEDSTSDRCLAVCLKHEADLLRGLGRLDEAAVAVLRMVALMEEQPDEEMLSRLFVADLAWHQAVDGDVNQALATLVRADAPDMSAWDPHGRIRLSLVRADILLLAGSPSDVVAAAAARGLGEMKEWDISTHNAGLLTSAVSQALLREGRVSEAGVALAPLTKLGGRPDLWMVHSEQGQVALRMGELERAAALFDAAASVPRLNYRRDGELSAAAADCELWAGRPQQALDRLRPVLRVAAGVSAAPVIGGAFVMAARAAADLGDVPASELEGLRASCVTDPLSRRRVPPDSEAWQKVWEAELARLRGTATMEDWASAAAEWDRLNRPHDAAYCRWRAAQVAVREGQGTIAARLLKKAALDAREHVPLSQAIAATRTGAP